MSNIPKPLSCFDPEIIPEFLIHICRCMGFTEPTLIQKYAIPICAKKVDLIALAKTGSGKTLAYMIPLITNIMKSKNNNALTQIGIFWHSPKA